MYKFGALCLFIGILISQPRALAWPDQSAISSSTFRNESSATNEPEVTYYAQGGRLEPDLNSIREDRPKQAPSIRAYSPLHSYYIYGQETASCARPLAARVFSSSPYVQTVHHYAQAAEAYESSPSPYVQTMRQPAEVYVVPAQAPDVKAAVAKAQTALAYMPLPASQEQVVESSSQATGSDLPTLRPYIQAAAPEIQPPAANEQFIVPKSFYHTDDDSSSVAKVLQLPDPNLKSQVRVRLDPSVLQQPIILGQFAGIASWYGGRFLGRKTASGERFCANKLTAASPYLPFGTKLFIHNKKSGKSVIVTVNDRGPFVGKRILDLSPAAASRLQMLGSGLANVEVQVVDRNLMAVNEADR